MLVGSRRPEFLELAERRTKALNAAYSQAMRAMPAPQRVHPFERVWPPIMIAAMFLLEGVWIVFLVYLSVKFIRLYF
jgi:hypothetical protein